MTVELEKGLTYTVHHFKMREEFQTWFTNSGQLR